MRDEEIKALLDQQAAGYDKQWAGMAPIREALYLLLDALFIDLPADARSTAALPSGATFTRAIWIRWRLGRPTTAPPAFWCRSFCSNRQCVPRSSARSRSA